MFEKLVPRGSVLLALAAGAISPAAAQTDHLWPRFAVDVGAYQISTSDEIRIDGQIGQNGQAIDLSRDIGLPDSESLLTGKLDWAFADHHSVELAYYSLDRSGSRSLTRTIEIDGTVFPVGASASADFESTSIEAAYTYWFMRRESFGLGGTLGLVYLSLDAVARASFQIGPGGGTISEEASASTDLPVPMIGVAVKGSPWERLVLYGRARFLPSVTVGDYSGEAGSYSLGADFYFWGPLAVGASYDGTYYNADVDKSGWHGSVDLVLEGWRAYLRAAF